MGTRRTTPVGPPPVSETHSPRVGRLTTFASLQKDSEWSFLADNEFISSGYRHRLSCCDALRSLCVCHNESVNVWTHLFGAALFVFLLVHLIFVLSYSYRPAAPDAQAQLISACGLGSLAIRGAHTPEMLQLAILAPRSAPWALDCRLPEQERVPDSLYAVLRMLRVARSEWRAMSRGVVDSAVHTIEAQRERAVSSLQSAQRALENYVRLAEAVSESAMERLGAGQHDAALALADARTRFSAAVDHITARAPEYLSSGSAMWHEFSERALASLGVLDRHVDVVFRAAALGAGFGSRAHGDLGDEATGIQEPVAQRKMAGGLAVWPFAVFIVSAAICLSCSTAFHLLHPVSLRLFHLLAKLDYTGIAVLIAGSNFPLVGWGWGVSRLASPATLCASISQIYLTFYCMPRWAAFHLSVLSSVSLGCIYLSLSEKFASRDYRLVRMTAFVVVRI